MERRLVWIEAVMLSALLGVGCASEAPGGSEDQAPAESSTEPGGSVSAGAGSDTQTPDTPASSLQPPAEPADPGPARPSSEAPVPAQLEPPSQVQPSAAGPSEPQQPGSEDAAQAPGAVEPTLPVVTGECPTFETGTLTFRGLGGIRIVAGAKAGAATAPMVFYWHGTGSSAGEFAVMAGAVRSGVEAEGGILVSFQGTTGGDALSGTAVFGRGDLELVDQLAACAVRDHNIDPRRIFTTGCSAGGLFATNLAVLRSEYIAAAAPNSGGLIFPQQFQNDYTPALMTVHGAPGRDVVIVDFSNTSATADRAFSARGGFVINCNHGGGHCGGAGLAADIWEFFKAHPYGVEPAPSPWTSALPSGFSDACELF